MSRQMPETKREYKRRMQELKRIRAGLCAAWVVIILLAGVLILSLWQLDGILSQIIESLEQLARLQGGAHDLLASIKEAVYGGQAVSL